MDLPLSTLEIRRQPAPVGAGVQSEEGQAVAVESAGRLSLGLAMALVPLLIAMPIMYWPKVLDSDTQPWVVIGAATAFALYWPQGRGVAGSHLWRITGLTCLAFAAYWVRSPDLNALLRYGGILATFLMLWHVGSRQLLPASVGTAVRATILIWFAIGLYQTFGERLGIAVEIFGRYMSGRSGVPSLTAEPSFYGSISVVHLMYLLTEKSPKNRIFMVIAVINVLLSGSLLSYLLLIIPAFRLPMRVKVMLGGAALILGIVGFNFINTQFFARASELRYATSWGDIIMLDQSTNIRFGHIWFTFVQNFVPEMLYTSTVDFELEYNAWAAATGTFMFTNSDYLLTSGGELLFRCGAVGLLLNLFIIKTAYDKAGPIKYDRLEKLAFVTACFLNPMSLANPFFIFYIHKKYAER